MNRMTVLAVFCTFVLIGCTETARLPLSSTVGPDPQLPPPNRTLLPTVNIAPAIGWEEGGRPTAAPGLKVEAFARGLDHPRWVYVLPNGDVLVAETNAPDRPEHDQGIRSWFSKLVMKRAGAGAPSANRIVLLRDADGDGLAEFREVFIEGLNSPFGMALVGNVLYVANTDAIMRFPYKEGQTRIDAVASRVADLEGGPINHHWTKNIIASVDGSRLYATVGSNSNVGERGLDQEVGRASIWEIDPRSGSRRLFASGLRNPNGLAWEPVTKKLWTVVNERDELGSDLVPDYLTSVADGAFYGWPWSYFGAHVDSRVVPARPDMVARAIKPDYALGSHVAPLGLVSSAGTSLPSTYASGMFIGEHGSWNRRPAAGYKVVFVRFESGTPVGQPIDVVTGFLSPAGEAYGRPVGVALDRSGALLVVDDVGNVVWRVSSAAGEQPQRRQ